MKLLELWNQYWFRPASLFHLAVCRVFIVGFQLGHLLFIQNATSLMKAASMPDFMYNPIAILHLLLIPFGWDYRPSLEMLLVVYWITLVTGFLALIGFKTNVCLLLFAGANIFLKAYIYSFGEFHHPESIMMIALLILALSPAGAVLSIDDLQRRVRLQVKRQKFELVRITEEKSIFARWPLLLIQWMFAMIYLSAALQKLGAAGADWMNGYTLQFYMLVDGIKHGSNLGLWFGQQHTLALWLSWVTILFEGSFFLVLIFPVLGWLYIPLGVALHTGIYLTMKAPFFQFMIVYVAFFTPWLPLANALSHYWKTLRREGRLEALFDGRCARSIGVMTMTSYFDWFDRITYSNLQERWQTLVEIDPEIIHKDLHCKIHVLTPDGSLQNGSQAFYKILGNLPLLWPLTLLSHLPFTGHLNRNWLENKRFS